MLAVDETPGAEIALFTFGSFTNPGRAEPSYAFMNTVLRLKRSRTAIFDAYYFKAKANDWYFSGSEGFETLEASLDHVRSFRRRYRQAIFLGNSMGGYGALLFGMAAEADAILAFSPQTRFDLEFCREIGEQRWQNEFAKMRGMRDATGMSVRALWPEMSKTRTQLFVGAMNKQDLAYCHDLVDLQGVKLHVTEESGHNLVHDLRASGQLEKNIFDAIQCN